MSLRDLKIKTNVVKRYMKELKSYDVELVNQQERISKLIKSGADDADVRKQKEVLEESVQMIPEVKRRLATAYQELRTLITDPQYNGTNELEEAQKVLDDEPDNQ
ncbi:hypothetical protein VKS41_005826 [Umbelopsis sp. WA50703]